MGLYGLVVDVTWYNYSYCDFTHQLKTGEDHDALEGSAQWFAIRVGSLIYQWDKPLGFSKQGY